MDFPAHRPVLLTVWHLPLFSAMVPVVPFCTLDPSLGKSHCLPCSRNYWGICLLHTFAPSVRSPSVSSRVSSLPPCESASSYAISFMKQSAVSSVQSLSRVQLFVTPWTAAHQAPLLITNSRSLLKLMSIESVMPSNRFILCRPFLLLPSIFPSIRVFSDESVLRIRWSKHWRSASTSVHSMNTQD